MSKANGTPWTYRIEDLIGLYAHGTLAEALEVAARLVPPHGYGGRTGRFLEIPPVLIVAAP